MAKWFNDDGFQSDIVLSTRIRLARNLKNIPFPGKMSEADAQKVIELVENVLEEMNYTFTKTDINEADENEKRRLVEEHWISPALAKAKHASAVYISEDENVSIMLNEEDHVRLQCIYAGFEDRKAYDLISKIDDYLSEKLDFAVHEKYGYLTSCLTNVGTGMRISYMLHLPAIASSSVAESIFSSISKLGVTVRGLYGEGSKSSGHIYQISNQITLGKDEAEIISNLNETVNSIIAKEREMRTDFYNKNGYALEDRIMRSYAILKAARIMPTREMLDRMSDVRFGLCLGLIDGVDYKTLSNLMVTASPAHISTDGTEISARDRDIRRAKIIREALA